MNTLRAINILWGGGHYSKEEAARLYIDAITPENFLEALEFIPDDLYDEFLSQAHIVCRYGTKSDELRTLLGKYLGYVFEE